MYARLPEGDWHLQTHTYGGNALLLERGAQQIGFQLVKTRRPTDHFLTEMPKGVAIGLHRAERAGSI
eukprot:11528800-Alexandrium_andersonii.AAC.1